MLVFKQEAGCSYSFHTITAYVCSFLIAEIVCFDSTS